jgi:hypothetical protein
VFCVYRVRLFTSLRPSFRVCLSMSSTEPCYVLVATRIVCVCVCACVRACVRVLPARSESVEMQPALMLSLNKWRFDRCDFELLVTALVEDVSGMGVGGVNGLKHEVSNKCARVILGFRHVKKWDLCSVILHSFYGYLVWLELAKRARLFSFNRTQYRAVIGLLTGYNTLRRHLYKGCV